MPESPGVDRTGRKMTPEEYLTDRVDDQILWYARKSRANKKGFIILQIITLIAAASVPVFSIFSDAIWARVLVAVLGSTTAVTTGIVSLYQFREHWIQYRTTAESLKHEKYLFQTGTGPYTGSDNFSVLVERIEALVSLENSAWHQRLNARQKEEPEQG